jgi:hypothetical protein
MRFLVQRGGKSSSTNMCVKRVCKRERAKIITEKSDEGKKSYHHVHRTEHYGVHGINIKKST